MTQDKDKKSNLLKKSLIAGGVVAGGSGLIAGKAIASKNNKTNSSTNTSSVNTPSVKPESPKKVVDSSDKKSANNRANKKKINNQKNRFKPRRMISKSRSSRRPTPYIPQPVKIFNDQKSQKGKIEFRPKKKKDGSKMSFTDPKINKIAVKENLDYAKEKRRRVKNRKNNMSRIRVKSARRGKKYDSFKTIYDSKKRSGKLSKRGSKKTDFIWKARPDRIRKHEIKKNLKNLVKVAKRNILAKKFLSK